MINNIKMRGTQKRRIALLKYWLPKKFRKLRSKTRKTNKKTNRKRCRSRSYHSGQRGTMSRAPAPGTRYANIGCRAMVNAVRQAMRKEALGDGW